MLFILSRRAKRAAADRIAGGDCKQAGKRLVYYNSSLSTSEYVYEEEKKQRGEGAMHSAESLTAATRYSDRKEQVVVNMAT